jgi:hypothetical protein
LMLMSLRTAKPHLAPTQNLLIMLCLLLNCRLSRNPNGIVLNVTPTFISHPQLVFPSTHYANFSFTLFTLMIDHSVLNSLIDLYNLHSLMTDNFDLRHSLLTLTILNTFQIID